MSRSHHYTPISPVFDVDSEKPSKKLAHRRLRAAERMAFANCRDLDDLNIALMREVSDVWDFRKEGKFRFDAEDAEMSKLMRK